MLEFLHDLKNNYPDFFNWFLFPLIIFCSRICDVSLGTLRSVLASKGNKNIVPYIGFFEVLLWLIAISQIMKNLNNVMCYFAWAGGYAMGSYIGLTIEEKLAIGKQVMRIITNQSYEKFLVELKKRNFGYTMIDGEGARGPVKLIFAVAERKKIKSVALLVNEHLPNSFYSVEDVKEAADLSYGGESKRVDFFKLLLPLRK